MHACDKYCEGDLCILKVTMNYTDARDKDNQTPLHHACKGGHIRVVRYLVEELKSDIGRLFH